MRVLSTEAPLGQIFEIEAVCRGKTTVKVANAGGASLANLTDVRFVDANTLVATADQTGNIEAPYKTFAQAALDLAPTGGTILVVGGDYSAEPTASFYFGDVAIAAFTPLLQNVLLPAVTCVGNLALSGVQCLGTVTAGIHYTSTGTLFASYSTFTAPVDTVGICADNCLFTSAGAIIGPVSTMALFERCNLDIPNVSHLTAVYDVVPSYYDCLFGNETEITFTGGTGTSYVDFDDRSLQKFRGSGGYIDGGSGTGTYLQYPSDELQGIEVIPPNPTLGTGRQLLVPITISADDLSPDAGVFVGCTNGSQPDGVVFSASWDPSMGRLELFANNYTGAPLNFPGCRLRWKVFAP